MVWHLRSRLSLLPCAICLSAVFVTMTSWLQGIRRQWDTDTSLLRHRKGGASDSEPRPLGGPYPAAGQLTAIPLSAKTCMGPDRRWWCLNKCREFTQDKAKPHRCRRGGVWPWRGAMGVVDLRDGSASCYVYWRYTGLAPPQDTFSIRPGGTTISSDDVSNSSMWQSLHLASKSSAAATLSAVD